MVGGCPKKLEKGVDWQLRVGSLDDSELAVMERRRARGLRVPTLDNVPQLDLASEGILEDFWRLRDSTAAGAPITPESLLAYLALPGEDRARFALIQKMDAVFLRFQADLSEDRRKKLRNKGRGNLTQEKREKKMTLVTDNRDRE